MPEYPIRDSILASFNAQEPWPDNVKLYQPYEVEQILLPDNASCLAVQAFLKMCNLPFEVEMRWNAEFMSPSGRVPFIKCGAFVVAELEPIAQFAANKGVSLCSRLSTEEKAEMRAYMSLITNVLVNAELYISWLDNDTFNQVTKVRNSSVYPWPLGWLQTRAKRNSVAKRLKALNWHEKTLEQVLSVVETCCNSLSQRLGDKDYFFGTATQLDALVYGHVRALLSAHGPKAGLMLKPITNAMLHHVVRMTNLVGMKLTPQEQYLLRQAAASKYRSPPRSPSDRSTRIRRSKLSVPHHSRDCMSRDVFGFKPFASKKIIIMTTNEGCVRCHQDALGNYDSVSCVDEEEYNLIIDIIEDIFEKVDDIVEENATYKTDTDTEKTDFEVIAFPNQVESKNDSLTKIDDNDSLTKIDDNDSLTKIDDNLESLDDDDGTDTDTTISIDGGSEDVIQIINDDNDLDSDGVVNDKMLLGAPEVDDDLAMSDLKSASPDLTDSSHNQHVEAECSPTEASSGDGVLPHNKLSAKSSRTNKSRFSSESRATLKTRSDQEITVETLLNYLRQQKETYCFSDVADVD